MAAVSTWKQATDRVFQDRVAGISTVVFSYTFTAAAGDVDDTLVLFDLPAGFRVLGCWFNGTSTFGAGCMLQVQLGTTALTDATIATGVSNVSMAKADIHPPAVSTSVQAVNLLISGADTAAAGEGEIIMMVAKL